ncbi:hypothetical protein [Aurantibacter sp.]|uniref:hypothetical protein n=1 Tax=Aurantibacter sp. TaxID=2807103 RepID=UPI0032639019
MKIVKIIPILTLFMGSILYAQEISDNTIGLRLGDSDGFGAEVSYQRAIGRYNRAELNLGFRDHRAYDAVKLSGVYQWVHSLSDIFNYYYGFGGGVGSVKFDPIPSTLAPAVEPDGGTFAFVAGDIGIECNFDLPILISLDIRPEIGVLGYDNFKDRFDFDIALGIRYQF